MSTSTRALATPRATSSVVELAREHGWAIAVWVAIVGWTAALFGIARGRYHEFWDGRFDLGNMVQAVWNTAEGRVLEISEGSTGEQMTRLGSHVDPFLALLAPAWMVWSSPVSLVLAQIAIVSLGALPVFWLGRRHLGSESAAGLLALGYLAYPWTATSAVGAIHPVTFAIPFLLFCVWCLDTERLAWFGVFAVLTMSTGELMGLPIVGLGIWYALARKERLAGAAIAVAGAAWTAIAVFLVVPAFAGEDSAFFGFYDHVGGSPQGLLRTLFTDPGAVVSALVETHDLVYLVWLGLPLLFLFVLSPGLAAVGLPQLVANVLSDFRSMSDPRYHTVAAVIPFLIAATVFGMRRIGAPRRTVTAAALLTCSVTIALAVGPWLRAIGETPLGGRERIPQARVEALAEAVALVPREAPVSASNTAGGHLSARRYVYSVPVLGLADWVVIDRGDPWVVSEESPILTNHPEVVRKLVTRLERDSVWRVVFDHEGVVVFRKRDAE